MRLLLKLKAVNDFAYDYKYYHKLQGWLYSLLKNTDYFSIHDNKGYKFFSFSNFFSEKQFKSQIKEGEIINLIISSPNSEFIKTLSNKLITYLNKNITIGEYVLNLISFRANYLKIKRKNLTLISSTPIVVRIPEKKYSVYQIPEKYRKKRYVFWRKEYSFNAFLKQLEENLMKKYNKFYNTQINYDTVFEGFDFIKPIVSHVVFGGKEQKIIGSLWKFDFSYLTKEQKNLLEFGMDTGLGELNSLGFGFMNVMK